MRVTTRRAAAAFAALALALTACGDDGDNGTAEGETDGEAAADVDLVSDGTLTVCTESPYEPFEFEDPDSPTGYSGFDMDLMYEIAQGAGLDMAVVNSGFDALTSGAAMTAGTCDVAASAMTITEERAENVDFSDEYYESLQSLLVPGDSDISSIADLTEGVTVGVQSGTTGEEYAEENVPGATLQAFEGGGDLVTALAAGQIDAILQDLPRNEAVVAQDGSYEIVEEYDTDEVYGFALEKGREDGLLDLINSGLQDLRDSGRYDELFEQYFVTIE
ncbi:MAG: transporter substrate-binding domain-containing protein [Actinobacteria bacterium]|jgi:polar amino acid transport system substrate-binding protein|nr:transporter substrate-binding domain-containing protein [Actinomycetota bacterium]